MKPAEITRMITVLELRIKRAEQNKVYPEDLLGVGLTLNEAKEIMAYLKSMKR